MEVTVDRDKFKSFLEEELLKVNDLAGTLSPMKGNEEFIRTRKYVFAKQKTIIKTLKKINDGETEIDIFNR